MANNAINKQLLVYHNSIEDQMLTHNSQLTLKSWNNIINVLKTQANVNADYIKKLHRWLFGDGTGEARVPGAQGFVEYVLSYNGEHGWNALTQKAPKRFSAYTADSDGEQTTTPVVSTVSEHGDYSATTYELENTIAMRDVCGCLRGFTRDSSGTIYGHLEKDDKLNEIGLNYVNMSYFRARWDELFGEGYLEAYDTIKEIGDAIKKTGEDIAGVKKLIDDNLAEVKDDISDTNATITSLNIKGGTGTESTQQIKAIANGVKSAAFNESLAVGERSHSEGTSNIEKNSQGEYNFEVTYTIKENGVDIPTSVIPLEPEPSSGSTTPSTPSTPNTKYLDGTDFLSFSNIELKTTGAVGISSHAEGYHTLAQGPNSHTEGSYNYANANDVHVEGCGNVADKHAAHAEGFRNIVRGKASHVEGMSNIVRGKAAHAEGFNNRVDSVHSHAEGVSNIVHAGASHAEGYYNAIMTGANSSHVEGTENTINEGHYNSHVGGRGNSTSAPDQTVIGRYNKGNADALFTVGNGRSNTDRGNAFVVLKDGRAILGKNPTSPSEAATKEYTDTKVPIINTLDGVRQPNISGKTDWNLWDTFVYTYSPKNTSIYGGVPKLMKVSQNWDPNQSASTNGLTIVQRTVTGTITAAEPSGDNDVVTNKYFKTYVSDYTYSKTDVVEALNNAIGSKADKKDIPTKLSQLEQDVELGVSEEDVMEIIENNSQETEEMEIAEAETINIGTSDNYDITSDNEIPTSKAVAEMCKKAKFLGKVYVDLENSTLQAITFYIKDLGLEKNKVYLVAYTEDSVGSTTMSIMKRNGNNGIFAVRSSWDDNPVIAGGMLNPEDLIIIAPHNYYFNIDEEGYESMDAEKALYVSEYDYVEVYELPFTLGGDE